jgi:hypothetical protein
LVAGAADADKLVAEFVHALAIRRQS